MPTQNNKSKSKHPAPQIIEGVLILTARGVGFVSHDSLEQDVRIPAENIGTALHGDTVNVHVYKPRKRGDQPEGKISKIIKRKRMKFVGTVEGQMLIADDKRFPHKITLSKEDLLSVHDGQKILIHIRFTEGGKPEGSLLEVIGDKGDHETEMRAILVEKGFDHAFSDDIEREAQTQAAQERARMNDEISKRRDYRDVPTFTIDPETAKDFDDALSVKKVKPGIFEIGIHIADVSHYVRPGSLIDAEAEKRAFSVYLVDRTIPMLPEVLSNDLCSLNPEEDKLAFSTILTMDTSGRVLKRWFGKTVIRSDKRFTYKAAHDVLETKSGDWLSELETLLTISKTLRDTRFKHGAIDFSSEEIAFELDEDGEPLRIYKKERLETHKLVEEFMLLANREVATYLHNYDKKQDGKRSTSIYRIHESPDPDALASLGIFLRALGYEVNFEDDVSSKDLQVLMKKVEGKAEEALIKTAAIRSMSKAIYSTNNIGHFGLAFQYYTHFTSPIRRYPDLLVHRILESALAGKTIAPRTLAHYNQIARTSSQREIQVAEAERESIKYKQVEYMEDHVGETFEGTISGVTEWGIYIEEKTTKAEGMVKISELGDDYYNLDKKTYSIIGEKTKKKFTLGDTVKFKIVDADLERRTLDFVLV